MEKLGLNELREKYLDFFVSKGHLRHPSSSLIPRGDNSLLLINSGMAPLKPYFSGEQTPPNPRMTTCQKCIRTPDIENVGKTSRHGTFFEMLGNFSFGDYFKREACAWAWEFITEVLDMPTDKLHVTVYLDDDETAEIWEKEIGVDPAHISRLGKKDNFWEIGSGPCGPCSEIYFDRGAIYGCDDPDCKPGCDCDRYVEFWNLVFTQYNNDGAGNYTDLAFKNIDTGMGLERLACIMQEVPSLFDVDTIRNIISHISEITGVEYGVSADKDVSLRVITDHIRSATMMISDGIRPSNEGRGYVLRRLLRRAARHGRLLGRVEPFLYLVCETVIRESREAYPELEDRRDYTVSVIKGEEESFSLTIDSGMQILGTMLESMQSKGLKILSGEDGFRLHDTYGFPIDLTTEILAEREISVDREAFDLLMAEQRERAREAAAAHGDLGWTGDDVHLPDNVASTEFIGYEAFEGQARVLAIVVEGELRDSADEGDNAVVILDKTPFYAASGGQVTDTGQLKSDTLLFNVTDVRKSADDKYLHYGTVKSGHIGVGDTVNAEIDAMRRRAIMRAHSGTHLLHSALREVLGIHVEQAGSLVSPDTIRFDFTHPSAVTSEQLRQIEEIVNDMILDGVPVSMTLTSMSQAVEEGAMALFGEKYGDTVRMVKMGDYSLELCGGTHLDNTAKIGSFACFSEFSVAAGVRRIEAYVGKETLEQSRISNMALNRAAAFLKTPPSELETRLTVFMGELRESRRLVDILRSRTMASEAQGLLHSIRYVEGLHMITATLPEAIEADDMRRIGDFLKDKNDNIAAVLSSVSDGKITVLAICGKEAVARGIKAGDLVKLVTGLTGGSGGGRPDSAMGGGKDVDKLESALGAVEGFIRETLAK